MKRIIYLGLFIMAISVGTGCQKVDSKQMMNQETEVNQEAEVNREAEVNQETEVNQEAEVNQETEVNFGPSKGFILSETQKSNLGDEIADAMLAIVDAVCQSKESVDLSVISGSDYVRNIAVQYARFIHPLVELASVTPAEDLQGVFRIDYGCTTDEHELVVKEFDAKVDDIIAQCMEGACAQEDYAKAVYEYLVKNCVYEYETYAAAVDKSIAASERKERYATMSAYNVIMKGTGVCMQLSQAYSYLMRFCGIEAMELNGMSEEPFRSNNVYYDGMTYGALFFDNHMWNAICLENQWYGVDVTFGTTILEREDATIQDAYRFWGMSEATDGAHFPTKASSGTPGYEVPENRSKEDLKDHVKGEDAPVEEGFGELLMAEMDSDLVYDYSGDAKGEGAIITAKTSGHQYEINVLEPKDGMDHKASEICYYLGSPEELTENPPEKMTVCIQWNFEPSYTDLVSFLNELCFCIVKGVEENLAVEPSGRTLKANGENGDLSESSKARSSRLAEVIKKREYKQLQLECIMGD